MDTELRNQLGELILQSLEDPLHYHPVFRFLSEYIRLYTEHDNLLIPLNQIQPQLTREQLSTLRDTNLFTIEHRFGLQYGYRFDMEYFKARVGSAINMLNTYISHPMPMELTEDQKGIFKACLLFNHRLYFETHELVEAIWMEETGHTKTFLQGIIQVAVGFHHLLYHNYYGAVVLMKDGTDKLRIYIPYKSGLCVQQFLDDVEPCQQQLQQLNQKNMHKFNDALIPRMHFSVTPPQTTNSTQISDI